MAKSKGKGNGGIANDNNWQAESDAETLVRAHGIKKDKGRHSAAMKHLRTKTAGMTAVLGEGKANQNDEV